MFPVPVKRIESGVPRVSFPRRVSCQSVPPSVPVKTSPTFNANSMVALPKSKSFGCVARSGSLMKLRYVHLPTTLGDAEGATAGTDSLFHFRGSGPCAADQETNEGANRKTAIPQWQAVRFLITMQLPR